MKGVWITMDVTIIFIAVIVVIIIGITVVHFMFK